MSSVGGINSVPVNVLLHAVHQDDGLFPIEFQQEIILRGQLVSGSSNHLSVQIIIQNLSVLLQFKQDIFVGPVLLQKQLRRPFDFLRGPFPL